MYEVRACYVFKGGNGKCSGTFLLLDSENQERLCSVNEHVFVVCMCVCMPVCTCCLELFKKSTSFVELKLKTQDKTLFYIESTLPTKSVNISCTFTRPSVQRVWSLEFVGVVRVEGKEGRKRKKGATKNQLAESSQLVHADMTVNEYLLETTVDLHYFYLLHTFPLFNARI